MRVSSYQRKNDDQRANAPKGLQNTGWKPILHWPSGLSSDLPEPSRELTPCDTPSLHYPITPLLHSWITYALIYGNVLYPFLQYFQVLR